MQYDRIAYFKAICEAGSITQAAEELYIARPSLSSALGTLERELGCSLLRRSKRGVEPTEAGQALYAYACARDRLFGECLRTIGEIKRRTRPLLRFGCAGGIVDAQVIARIYAYEDCDDGVAVEIVNRECPDFFRAIETGELDLALTVCPPAGARVAKVCVHVLDQFIIVNQCNALASKQEVDFTSDLRGVTLLETEGRLTPYMRILESLGIQRKMVGEDRGFIKQLIERDRGCVITVPSLLERYTSEHACIRKVVHIPHEIDLNPYLVFRPDANTRVRRLVNHVLACLGTDKRVDDDEQG